MLEKAAQFFRSRLRTNSAAAKSAETEAFLDSQTIPGWLTEAESRELYRLAGSVPNDRPVCCEIGTWIGKSAVMIALALKHKRHPKLHCVDPFDLVKDEPWHVKTFEEQMGCPLLSRKATFLRTLKMHGVEHIASPMEAFSHEAAGDFHRPLDFLFIDGDHNYEGVLRDYHAWSPKLKPGGILCFHDYHPPEFCNGARRPAASGARATDRQRPLDPATPHRKTLCRGQGAINRSPTVTPRFTPRTLSPALRVRGCVRAARRGRARSSILQSASGRRP